MVVLGADENWDGRLVEPAPLAIPLFDAIQCTLAGEIKHEENGDCVVAHKRQHVDKLSLTTEIPDRKGDFRVADRDCLFHEIDTQRLDIILIPAPLDVLDHQRGLADLRITNHSDLDDNMVSTVG